MVRFTRWIIPPVLVVASLASFTGCDTEQSLAPDFKASANGSGSTPAAPSNVNAVAASFSQINLSWQDNSSNETGFELHRSTTGLSGAFTLLASLSANVTSYGNSGLSASTQYCYKVRAFRKTGNNTSYSAFSNTTCATTLALPRPPAPSGVNATPRFGYAISVTWTDNSANETGFRVERAASGAGPWTLVATTGPNVTSRDDSQFPGAEQPACYRVFATNGASDSDPSNVDCTTPPAAPTNLAATVAADGSVDLTWTDNSAVEDGYEVLRGGAGAEGLSLVAAVPANSTGYRDVGLADSSYGYVVRAAKDGGASASTFVQAVVATMPPNPPTDVSAAPQSSSAVLVLWVDASMNEEGSRVERSNDGGATWVSVYTTGWYFAPSSFWDEGRPSEQHVCYRVIAFNRIGDSPPSNTDCTTPPAAPTGFTATVVDAQTVDFAWTDNSAVEDGHLIGIDYGYGYWEFVAWVGPNTTSFRLEGYPYAMYQTYFVVATKDGGYSDWSNSVYVTPPSGSSSAGSLSRVRAPRKALIRRTKP